MPVPSAIPPHWAAHQTAAATHPAPRGYQKGVAAVAEGLFTTHDGPPDATRVRWLCAEVDDFIAGIGPRSRRLFRLSLFVVVWLAPLFSFRLGAMTWYSPQRRTAFLHRFERSFASPTLLLVKAILSIVYYEHPDAAVEVGFDGQCLGRVA